MTGFRACRLLGHNACPCCSLCRHLNTACPLCISSSASPYSGVYMKLLGGGSPGPSPTHAVLLVGSQLLRALRGADQAHRGWRQTRLHSQQPTPGVSADRPRGARHAIRAVQPSLWQGLSYLIRLPPHAVRKHESLTMTSSVKSNCPCLICVRQSPDGISATSLSTRAQY